MQKVKKGETAQKISKFRDLKQYLIIIASTLLPLSDLNLFASELASFLRACNLLYCVFV